MKQLQFEFCMQSDIERQLINAQAIDIDSHYVGSISEIDSDLFEVVMYPLASSEAANTLVASVVTSDGIVMYWDTHTIDDNSEQSLNFH